MSSYPSHKSTPQWEEGRLAREKNGCTCENPYLKEGVMSLNSEKWLSGYMRVENYGTVHDADPAYKNPIPLFKCERPIKKENDPDCEVAKTVSALCSTYFGP